MRNLLRLVLAVVFGAVFVAAAIVVVPLAWRHIYQRATTSVPRPLAALTAAPEKGSTVYAANGQVLAVLADVLQAGVAYREHNPAAVVASVEDLGKQALSINVTGAPADVVQAVSALRAAGKI